MKVLTKVNYRDEQNYLTEIVFEKVIHSVLRFTISDMKVREVEKCRIIVLRNTGTARKKLGPER